MENKPIDAAWWQSLAPAWKQAFAETFFKHNNEPAPAELAQLYECRALRFAGPTASYPNMSLELEDCSGLKQLCQLEILVIIHHKIRHLADLSGMENLKSLFINHNRVEALDGIEQLTGLTQLYVQHNRIRSLLPVRQLVHLRECYVHDNELQSLEGLTEAHAETLEHFFCKPNPALKQKEMLRIERELGIRCRSL